MEVTNRSEDNPQTCVHWYADDDKLYRRIIRAKKRNPELTEYVVNEQPGRLKQVLEAVHQHYPDVTIIVKPKQRDE